LNQAPLEERGPIATGNLVMVTIIHTITVIDPLSIMNSTPASIFPTIPTISSLGGQPVFSVTLALMSDKYISHSIADGMVSEIRILIRFSVAGGILGVLGFLVLLYYAYMWDVLMER
jgi:hypothetical protein